MADEQGAGHTVRIGGNVSGQVAIGNHNVQYSQRVHAPVTAADLDELRRLVAELRGAVGDDPQAGGKLDDLQEALTGEQVDLATVEHVQGWFQRKLPKFSAAVSKVILGPIVAKLVAAGGDQIAEEFTRRLGG
jgi:hypothetical protein